MDPPPARINPIDARLVNAEPLGDLPTADPFRTQSSYFEDFEGRQLGEAVTFATVRPAVADFVQDVLPGRPPTQIVEAIVARVSVEMQAFHPCRTGADEGFKDETMDKSVADTTVDVQADGKMPPSGIPAWLDLPPVDTHLPGIRSVMDQTALDDPIVADAVAKETLDSATFGRHCHSLDVMRKMRVGRNY